MPDEQIKIGLAIVSDAGTRKTLTDLAEVRKRIADLKNEFKSGAKDTDTFTKELSDLEKQAKKLDKALDEVGEKRRIDIDSGALANPEQTGAGAGLRAAGRGLRNLPSVQIPGAGFGTDAVGNVVRVTGSIIDLTEKSKVAAAATALLTPALGAQAAATYAAYAPIALLTGGVIAIGLAIKSLVDSTSTNVERINSFGEQQRDLNKQIADGLTTEEAQEELDKLSKAQERNKATLAQLQGAYDESQRQLGVLGGVAKAFSGDEEALANQINETNKTISEQQARYNTLTGALKDGSLAANDAAEAEKKLKEERTKSILDGAAAAGQEEAARRRALDATEEQNNARLENIEDERAAIQKQIDYLQANSDASEQVTDQIEKLTGSLSSLGAESDFIKNTALEASRARDAEKKAKKDAEDAAKKAEAAQEKYTDSVKNAGRNFTEATQDIRTKLKQGLTDNLTSLLRDATDLATKYQRDTVDLESKSRRDERDNLIDHYRNIEDIQEDALKSREEALQSGDFKAAYLAQRAGEEALKNEQKQLTRKDQDRQRALSDERGDLLQNAQRERADRLVNYERQNADSRLAADRELQQARLAKSRALSLASEGYNAELAKLGQFWQQYSQITAGGMQQALKQAGKPGAQSNPGAFNPTQTISGSTIDMSGVFANILQR